MLFESSPRGHRHVHHHNAAPPVSHVHEYGEQARRAPVHGRVVEYEYPRAPLWAQEANKYSNSEEDVNREAEEFIRMEHKKFELSKETSMKRE